MAELFTWAYRSDSSKRLEKLNNLFKSAVCHSTGFCRGRKIWAGQVQVLLGKGITVNVPDLLIAATALEFDYTVATHNTSHFSVVPGIRLQDWLSM